MICHLIFLMKPLLLLMNILQWQDRLLYTSENIVVCILNLHKMRFPYFWNIALHHWVIGAWQFGIGRWFHHQQSSDFIGQYIVEEGTIKISQHVTQQSSSQAAQCPRRTETWTVPLQKLKKIRTEDKLNSLEVHLNFLVMESNELNLAQRKPLTDP